MKTFIITTSLLLLCASLIQAQDIKKAQPDSIIKIIPFGEGRYSDFLYTIGGKLQTREDVLIRLMRYAPSAPEVSKAKTNLKWTYVSFAGAAIAGTAAVIEYSHNNKLAGATTGIVNGQAAFIYQHHSLTSAYIFTGAATALLTSAFINLIQAGKHGKRALKLYNQQYE
ncbi:MAG: hypothetical protein JST50_22680 [Bacteroidetes bacterium]|jgi:hypothetical protein|nr:hypothetical protein [Bacteroidota bacterium]